MEKIKTFFSNYKSDILNVLGVIALVAVVVVGAVLFFGKDDAQPNVVEDNSVVSTTEATTEAETTTTEPETTVSAATETTTKVLTTTTKPAQKPAETPTKAPVNNTPNNTPVNKEEGTLPAGLVQNCEPGDGLYEMNLASYNQDARIVAAYEKIKRENIAPSFTKKGSMYWEVDGELVTLCKQCGKPNGNGTHGTCTHFLHDANCVLCGQFVKAGVCHTCKY